MHYTKNKTLNELEDKVNLPQNHNTNNITSVETQHITFFYGFINVIDLFSYQTTSLELQ